MRLDCQVGEIRRIFLGKFFADHSAWGYSYSIASITGTISEVLGLRTNRIAHRFSGDGQGAEVQVNPAKASRARHGLETVDHRMSAPERDLPDAQSSISCAASDPEQVVEVSSVLA